MLLFASCTQLFRLTSAGDVRVNGLCLGQHSSIESKMIVTTCDDKQAITDWTYDEVSLYRNVRNMSRMLYYRLILFSHHLTQAITSLIQM